MTETIREQILAIRDTGLTNMFDVRTVQRLAFDQDFYELVCYLEEESRMALLVVYYTRILRDICSVYAR